MPVYVRFGSLHDPFRLFLWAYTEDRQSAQTFRPWLHDVASPRFFRLARREGPFRCLLCFLPRVFWRASTLEIACLLFYSWVTFLEWLG